MSAVTYDVIIVGAGAAGSATAFHLAKLGVRTLVVERGSIGRGAFASISTASCAQTRRVDADEVIYQPYVSGTNVFEHPDPSCIKMGVQLYASTTQNFVNHHGEKGPERYLRLTRKGMLLQKEIAKKVLPRPSTQLVEKGSLYVCTRAEVDEFREEFALLRAAMGDNGGKRVQWWDTDQVKAEHGPDAPFHAGIYFPHDYVIDSVAYSQGLIRHAVGSGHCTVLENTNVVRVDTVLVTDRGGKTQSKGRVFIDNSTVQYATVLANHVVVATGGLFHQDPVLSKIVRPCWSYLSAIGNPADCSSSFTSSSSSSSSSFPAAASFGSEAYSMNYFTYGFCHDWCVSNGQIRVSGQDHFSALKPPRCEERCAKMDQWIRTRYPFFKFQDDEKRRRESYKYGVYSETPDSCMVLGTLTDESRVFYMSGDDPPPGDSAVGGKTHTRTLMVEDWTRI